MWLRWGLHNRPTSPWAARLQGHASSGAMVGTEALLWLSQTVVEGGESTCTWPWMDGEATSTHCLLMAEMSSVVSVQ